MGMIAKKRYWYCWYDLNAQMFMLLFLTLFTIVLTIEFLPLIFSGTYNVTEHRDL